MVCLFVGTWAYILLVVAAHVLLDPPEVVVRWALLPVLPLVVVGGFMQFSIRCPACGYRLGRQSGLLVPASCRACGTALRQPHGTD